MIQEEVRYLEEKRKRLRAIELAFQGACKLVGGGTPWHHREKGRLWFPQVVQTTLRLYVVQWSEKVKNIILIKRMVSWKEGWGHAFERKHQIPQRLLHRFWEKGWLFPFEVCCRGFPAQSVWRMFTAI